MKTKNVFPYIIIFPGALLMIGLVFYPILVTFGYSLQRMKLTQPTQNEFIWFENYATIFQDPEFWYSLQNSLIILIFVVLLSAVIGLLVALFLNIDTRIKGLLTAIAIVPWALPPIVNGILWRWIFHPSYGFLNKLLLKFALIEQPIQWLSGRYSVVLIASLVASWRNIPFCAIVLLAALQSIPTHLYESAKIDGCNALQTFKKITFPLLLPSFGIVLTSTSITALNVFDEIVSLSGYGDVSKTLMINSYLRTFSFLDFGMGSALTYVVMLLASILGIIYIRNMYKEVAYL